MTQRTTPTTIKPMSRGSSGDNSSDKLLTVMLANLQRAKEPALIVKLREAVDRIQAARRRCP